MNEHRQDNTHAQDHKHRYAHTLSASSSSTCIYNHITITTYSPFYFRKSNVKSKIMKMITRTLAANSSPCLCCLHHHRHHHRPHHMISQTQEEKQQQQEEQQQSHGQRQQRYFSLSSLSSSPLLCFALISYLLLSLLSSSTTTAAQSNVGAISVPLPPPHAAALAAPGGVGSSILDQFSPNCSAVSHVFQARGIDLGEVPQKPSNEMVLRYCESPTVGTCCTYNMETKMAMQSRLQLEKHSKEQILKLSSTFASKANKFNDVFRKLLLESKEEFHNMFTRTYGIIYQQNSYVFSDLFNELESYYARGRVDLIEVMDKFFNVLYQKMFQVLNSQYLFDEKYLRCVSEHMKELKPFGDVPDKLSVQIKRSFVATRTFAHALLTAAEVSKKLVNVRLNADCTAALTKMQHCGACKGYAEKPCTNYCVNVIKGCLHYFSDFDVEWENFASAMDKVAERLLGSFNIVMVVEPINIKISEAIMNFQDSGQDITSRVFQGCGRPALGRVNQNPKFAAIAQQPQEQHQQFIAGSSNGGNGGSIDSGSSSGNADSRLVMRRAALEESAAEQIESDILDIDAALDDAIVLREKRVPEPQTEHDVASVSDEPSTAPRSGGGVNAGGNGGGGGSGENGGRAGGGGRRNQKRKQKKGDDSEHVAYDPVLDKMVRDIRQRVKDSKKFWSNLPHQICSNDEISASSDIDGMCWNGHTIDRYMHSVTTEHGRNPEFPGNPATTRQTSQVATQLYYLKNVISHLRNAYNGQDVDWSEQEEPYYGSGSGSGGGNDDEDDDEGSGLGSPFTPSRKPDHTDHPAVHVNQNVDDEDDEDAVDERHDGAGRAGTGTDAHTTRPKYTGESGGDTNGLDEDLDLGAGGQSNEIDGDDEKSNGSGSASTKPQKMSLRRALLVYLLPLFMAWFGGIFADLL